MNVIKYIGRKTDFKGHTLWEIVGSSKDYAIGRLVIRNMFQRYPEPCYFRIKDVEILPDSKETHKVRVWAEKTWRGVTAPQPVVIYSSSYKADYSLVPVADEIKFTGNKNRITEKVLSNTMELPPLFREFVADETGEVAPKIAVRIRNTPNKFVRLAKENEKPTQELSIGFGQPAPIAKKLYENLQI